MFLRVSESISTRKFFPENVFKELAGVKYYRYSTVENKVPGTNISHFPFSIVIVASSFDSGEIGEENCSRGEERGVRRGED